MKLTLFINPEHPPGDAVGRRLAEHAEQVRVARQAGFDGVVIGHHLSCGTAVWLPPLATLARLAAETDGMAIGTCMLVLPLFHPVHVAEDAALLDVLTGGRLVRLRRGSAGRAAGARDPARHQRRARALR